MKTRHRICACIVVVLCATGSNAGAASAGQVYGGLQYARSTYQEDGFEELHPSALVARLGKYFHDAFALEGRFGLGVQDDSIGVLGIDVSLEIDSMLGVYGVGHLALNQTSSVYGILGITRGEATASAPGVSQSADKSDLSYGVGADIGLGGNTALNIEYVSYLDKSDAEFSAVALGVKFMF